MFIKIPLHWQTNYTNSIVFDPHQIIKKITAIGICLVAAFAARHKKSLICALICKLSKISPYFPRFEYYRSLSLDFLLTTVYN